MRKLEILVPLLLLLAMPSFAEETAAPQKVPVELYDSKGAMIAEIKVEQAKLDEYTAEQKAKGITVKPLPKASAAETAGQKN